jgi:AcrR family transcriptional regulator
VFAPERDLTAMIRSFYSNVCFIQLLAQMNIGRTTKERILDAAERLFAERGFDGTSLRAITTEAGANLAAVNYHFRSKNDLIHEVFSRRLAPINVRRLAMLDACEHGAGNGAVPLEEVVRAFVEPLLRPEGVAATGRVTLHTLLGRMYIDPGGNVRRIFFGEMEEVVRRFRAGFQRALPGIPLQDLYWRLHFTIGAMAHTLAGSWIIEMLSSGLCKPSDVDGTIDRLVAFAVAGLKAPLPRAAGSRQGRPGRRSSPRRVLKGRETL